MPDDKYLNSLINDSSIIPELIEYYDLVDDVSSSPDVYPDPDDAKKRSENADRKNASMGAPNRTTVRVASTAMAPIAPATPITTARSDTSDRRLQTVNSITGSGTKRQQSFHLGDVPHNEDLREHDLIDNIMYIYYGSNVALRKSLGSNIIIVGTVFALAAQILAVIFTLLRNR